jgi:defect-in-organelle-trafficking protein DotC
MASKLTLLAAVSAITVALSSCTTTSVSPQPDVVKTAADAPLRADVNPGVTASAPANSGSDAARSPEDILSHIGRAPKESEPKKGEDKLRLPAMQEAAVAYGAQAGLAYATQSINKTLLTRAAELSKTYNFQLVMLQAPNGAMIVPPVISEALDTWETADAGKTLRVADKAFEIEEQVKFSPVAPQWQSYLLTQYKPAEKPPSVLLPKNDEEEEQFKGWVAQGLKKGQEQAEAVLQANLDRLNRDYTGMIRYKKLIEEKQVSPPCVAEANLGTTGTGQDMRQNDRAIRITCDPTLNVQSRDWTASATSTNPAGKPVGADKPAPETKAAPKPVQQRHTQRQRPKPAPKAVPAAPAKSVDQPTSGGANRF